MNQQALLLLTTAITLVSTNALGQFTVEIDIEEAPFHYTETADHNRVSRLIEQINKNEVKLQYAEPRGYLDSLLAALEIPRSSQTLVFSKTSLQVRYISRRNPRAIYFNDDTYVGWVNGSSMVEISTVDSKLGAAFYTVEMSPWQPKFARADYDCLACHATSMTQGIPGHTVRSVMPTYDGSIDSQLKSFITSDQSPIGERWGGWYVTGMHGEMQHLGNAYLKGGTLDTRNNQNRMNLRDDFDTWNYLSPYSDIVALMVLEHQTQMHNAMTRADFFIKKLLHEQHNAQTDQQEFDLQRSLIAQEVVRRLLFCEEAELTDEVRGSVLFANDFQSNGMTDQAGRSLRQFDLKKRMFKYPCSYLIYSSAFQYLEKSLRNEIVRQLKVVLRSEQSEDDMDTGFSHLSNLDRKNLAAILAETHPDF